VTRYLLDTNIISNVLKPEPSTALLAWLGDQADEDVFIASFTVAEIRRGILIHPHGRKRKMLEEWFSGAEGPQALFAGRILGFDEAAALVWADIMAHGRITGRPRSPLDMIIASVAIANDCTIVTDNENDFFDLDPLNPIRPARR
jgi:predicted nucleic acid-binding protein